MPAASHFPSDSRFELFASTGPGIGIHRGGRAQEPGSTRAAGDRRSCVRGRSRSPLPGESLAAHGEPSRCEARSFSRQHVLRAGTPRQEIAVGGVSTRERTSAAARHVQEIQALSLRCGGRASVGGDFGIGFACRLTRAATASTTNGETRTTRIRRNARMNLTREAMVLRVIGQLFIVRIVHDQVEISADSSGELLHRRGYRQEVAKAPLRETLAAAMVLASGWRRGEPLLDPMCGSGTIPIEAALDSARHRARRATEVPVHELANVR